MSATRRVRGVAVALAGAWIAVLVLFATGGSAGAVPPPTPGESSVPATSDPAAPPAPEESAGVDAPPAAGIDASDRGHSEARASVAPDSQRARWRDLWAPSLRLPEPETHVLEGVAVPLFRLNPFAASAAVLAARALQTL